MFTQYLLRASRLGRNVRHFRSNVALRDVKEVTTSGTKSAAETAARQTKTPDTEEVLGRKLTTCSNLDKRILVWMKKFPNMEAIPEKVPTEVLNKAQNQARIRLANLMIAFTIGGCIWAVVTGKRDAKAGKTLFRDNQDWHAKINEEYKAGLVPETKTT